MSVDTIYASLNELSASIDYLEQEIARKDAEREEALKAAVKAALASQPKRKQSAQTDLFMDWGSPSRPANTYNKDAATILAKKLDNAIGNVQWLLKQAEA